MNLNKSDLEIKVVRTDRKSFCIKSEIDGFVVRVPQKASDTEISDFLNQHNWLKEHGELIILRANGYAKRKNVEIINILKVDY